MQILTVCLQIVSGSPESAWGTSCETVSPTSRLTVKTTSLGEHDEGDDDSESLCSCTSVAPLAVVKSDRDVAVGVDSGESEWWCHGQWR